MTEVQWITSTDPTPMLEFLRGKVSDRKLRLFAVARCRQVWDVITDERSRKAVDVAESYADGLTDEENRWEAWDTATAVEYENYVPRTRPSRQHQAASAASYACYVGRDDLVEVMTNSAISASLATGARAKMLDPQVALLRDIAGNPFRPTTIERSLLTTTVMKIAEAIYNERTWERLPILADALEDAGVTDPQILGHCRGAGPHSRGCHVVDAILGKT